MLTAAPFASESRKDTKKPCENGFTRLCKVRSTGLEPVPIAGHAPQTCAYADSATAANNEFILSNPNTFVK